MLEKHVSQTRFLCLSQDLSDGGAAVAFELAYFGRVESAFVVRFRGQVQAYLNRCSHVPIAMDDTPNQFFDSSGQWLICATHGAVYDPVSGHCRMGPCRGGLAKIEVSEHDGQVHWHTSDKFQPIVSND
jgi:nitrite reductase/ring-hydroxylating ferredoxin subunit